MKATLVLILTFLLLPFGAKAHTEYLSMGGLVGDRYHLDLVNAGSEEESLWIRYYDQKRRTVEERVVTIPSQSYKKIDLTDLQNLTEGISLFSRENTGIKAEAWLERDQSFHRLPLSGLASDSLTLRISGNADSVQRILRFYNPTHLPTQITLRKKGEEVSSLQQFQLGGHQSLSIDFASFVFTSPRAEEEVWDLEIESEVKVVANLFEWTKTRLKVQLAEVSEPLLMEPPKAEKVFFLVGPHAPSESGSNFVVALSDVNMVAKAREVAGQPNGPILVGKLARTSGGFNRDFSHPAGAAWSWHVSEALEFSDFGSQKCDGSPQMVEELLVPWMEGIGTICFWNYRLIRELSSEEIAKGRLN